MSRSKMLAGLIGPTLLAIGAALLVNVALFPTFVLQVSRDPLLLFLTGILLFVAGLAIVRSHNVWSGGWPVLVTALGWLAIMGGLLRMLFPAQLAAMAGSVADTPAAPIAGGIIALLVGAFLSLKGYSRA